MSESPEALIFDVDGTLAETEELHRAAFNAVFVEAGFDWQWDVPLYAQLLKVTGGKERLRHYCDLIGISHAVPDSAIARMHRLKNDHYAILMRSGRCALRKGVEALIRRAYGKGMRLAIATTTSRANVDVLLLATLGKSGISMFETIAAGDEVARKKPAPDVYLKVLADLKLPAAACLAFEDSATGLKAAMAAGIPTIVTPGIYTANDDFTGAFQVVADVGDLQF